MLEQFTENNYFGTKILILMSILSIMVSEALDVYPSWRDVWFTCQTNSRSCKWS